MADTHPPPYILEPTPYTPLPSYPSSPILSPIPTRKHHPVLILGRWSSVLQTLLRPSLADLVWLTSLNLLGALLTLVQLPIALLLAYQSYSHKQTRVVQGEPIPVGRNATDRIDRLRDFTQIMWDWHDRLEEAELELPSLSKYADKGS